VNLGDHAHLAVSVDHAEELLPLAHGGPFLDCERAGDTRIGVPGVNDDTIARGENLAGLDLPVEPCFLILLQLQRGRLDSLDSLGFLELTLELPDRPVAGLFFEDVELRQEVGERILIRFGRDIVIVHGAAPGIDWAFTRACQDLSVKQEAHPARWNELDVPGAVIRQTKDGTRYNANAAPMRNAEMVAAGAEMCIAFHRRLAWSRRTKDCVRRAIAAGIPAYLIDSEQARPRRLRAGDVGLG
jgi:hypothetical protein